MRKLYSRGSLVPWETGTAVSESVWQNNWVQLIFMGSVNYFLSGSVDIGICIKGYGMLIEELPIPFVL